MTVETLLEAATALPLPGIDQMLADIFEGVRMSMLDISPSGRPDVSAEALIASDMQAA